MTSQIKGWVEESKLRWLLECIALFMRYDFTDDDWNAVRFGIADTFAESGAWFEYEFVGDHTAELRLAFDEPGSSVVIFEMSVPPDTECKVGAAVEIVQHFGPQH